MQISHIPTGFTSVTPYFILSDTGAFSAFVRDAFDAQVIDEHFEGGILMHGAYRIFGSMIESGTGNETHPGNRISIHLYVADCDDVFQKAIEAGGKEVRPVADMPYGERSGGVEDPCGNQWWISTQQVDMYPDNK